MTKKIFVFGSNTGGIHGAGAARHAFDNEGAAWGQGFGHYGNSFAIPTKGVFKSGGRLAVGNTLPMAKIEDYVKAFLKYANDNPSLSFQVTRIGCGLAGLTDEQIATMFLDAPPNCLFDSKWKDFFDQAIGDGDMDWRPEYWGTF